LPSHDINAITIFDTFDGNFAQQQKKDMRKQSWDLQEVQLLTSDRRQQQKRAEVNQRHPLS
jgi:hypothetical protein